MMKNQTQYRSKTVLLQPLESDEVHELFAPDAKANAQRKMPALAGIIRT